MIESKPRTVGERASEVAMRRCCANRPMAAQIFLEQPRER